MKRSQISVNFFVEKNFLNIWKTEMSFLQFFYNGSGHFESNYRNFAEVWDRISSER